jgi:hypothetical protein
LVKKVTAGSATVPFKTDELTWGVTDGNSARLTLRSFGNYKSPTRLDAEVALSAYLTDFSEPRYAGGSQSFAIATAVAPPGTGKSRLLDDAVHGEIAAEVRDGKAVRMFDPRDILLLTITFSGGTTAACVHDVASRCALEFFCGQPKIDRDAGERVAANEELVAIDQGLERLLNAMDEDELAVLDALEALFSHARGGWSGRSVLLVDEISKAASKKAVYGTVVEWVDYVGVPIAGRNGCFSPRGAVFTGLTLLSPWAKEITSGREIVSLALGLFNMWDAHVQQAILHQVQAMTLWSSLKKLPESVWSLLASTGGRPRDIESILGGLAEEDVALAMVSEVILMNQLFMKIKSDAIFNRYVLPSMLSVPFVASETTQFGRDASSSALLNADLLAVKSSAPPAVSLRYALSLPAPLHAFFRHLVFETTFFELNGSGKDFEHVWVLLVQMHLLLQHRVRWGSDHLQFWPQGTTYATGGAVMPTGAALDVFAQSAAREKSLFAAFDPSRVHETHGSTVHRSINFLPTVEPTVMVWHNLWVADVQGSTDADSPPLWADSSDDESASPSREAANEVHCRNCPPLVKRNQRADAPNECIKISHNCNALMSSGCNPRQIWKARSRTKSRRVFAIRWRAALISSAVGNCTITVEQQSCEEFHLCCRADQDRLLQRQARTKSSLSERVATRSTLF